VRLAALAGLIALAIAPALAGEARLTAEMPGSPTLTLEARGAGDRWMVRVLEGRSEVQRIEVETEVPDGTPFLADANGDGAPDLLVPSALGNANAVYELWTYDQARRRFARAGEIAGIAFGRDGPWVVSLGRDGCCGAVYSFQSFAASGELEDAFAIEVGLSESGRPSRCAPAPDSRVTAEVLRRYCAMRLGTLPGQFGPPR
jgi:hypothetical protein